MRSSLRGKQLPKANQMQLSSTATGKMELTVPVSHRKMELGLISTRQDSLTKGSGHQNVRAFGTSARAVILDDER